MSVTRLIHQWTGRKLRAQQRAKMLANLSEWEQAGLDIDRSKTAWALCVLLGVLALILTHACLGQAPLHQVNLEVSGALPAEAKAQPSAKGLDDQTQPGNKPLMRSGTRLFAATGKTQNTAGNISDAFLTALEGHESNRESSAVGKRGERGSFQFRRVAWIEVSQARARRGWPVVPFAAATNRVVARVYAGEFLNIQRGRLLGALKREPTERELLAAWSLGFHGFKRRGFDLKRCPAATRRLWNGP